MDKKDSVLVSIITPTYNAENFILETIESVVNQTYPNWELLIVDDCSQDSTIEKIKFAANKDRRIKLYILQENSGAAVARNRALREAKGKYVAFLDSDDLWEKEKLEKQLNFMLENNIAFSFSSYKIIDTNGDVQKVINVPNEITYKQLLKNTIIGCLTVMLDREKLGIIQMPNIRTRQDTALWLSILKKGNKAFGIQEPLAKYRKVQGSISSNKYKMAKRNWEMYRKIEGLNLLMALWCFLNYAFNGLKKNI
ncbi:glycosyltransferase family 2 protein [Cytobacillus firmus]|uniref:glycosyltransferase family 2 protein n=1 Tax=Cytobacillus firmus TaxID=1399 RepID=UPI002494C7F7|nr:glycosyltransferase family 2 protein [Cytobacillus firmus]